jgi:putative sugar O-methyltransferase
MIADPVAATASMLDELERDPLYLPSAFWRELNEQNMRMLAADGIDNFKRSLNQNYYNWLVVRRRDQQFRHAFKDWLGQPNLAPLRTRMERDLSLRAFDAGKRYRWNWRKRLVYRLFVGFLWERMLRFDRAGIAQRIAEPEAGNPLRIWRAGKLISQDLANSIIECNLLVGELAGTAAPRVAEIGAGYGRLAQVFSATQKGSYYIFDIPPALGVAQWYLAQTLPQKKLFAFRPFENFAEIEAELAAADIAIFTANQLEKFPAGYFDAIVSISTLPEMRPDQVRRYIALMQQASRGLIFLKQWKSFTNPRDGTALNVEDYRFDPAWQLVIDQTDPVQPKFFNRVWRRRFS